MSRRHLRGLEKLKNMQFSFPIEADGEGYIDRQCPAEECFFVFKVYEEDWKSLFRDEEVLCPMCGKAAPADHFHTFDQLDQAKPQAVEYAQVELNRAMVEMARDFNRRQPRDAFIKLRMDFKGKTMHDPIVPLKATKELELEIRCEKCNARFAVLGSAFFCPCCGHSSAVRVFQDALGKIGAKLTNLDRIRKAVAEVSEDQAAVTCRSLLESGISDAVVAFQRFCEELYGQHPNAKLPVPMNVFQRLDQGSALWKELIGKGYEDFLKPDQLTRLSILFQRRHLLMHREGIVDQKYIDRSGDTAYAVGQRIVVTEADVAGIAQLVEVLARGLREERDRASQVDTNVPALDGAQE